MCLYSNGSTVQCLMELFSIRKDKRFKKKKKNAVIVIKASLLRAILKSIVYFSMAGVHKGPGQVSGERQSRPWWEGCCKWSCSSLTSMESLGTGPGGWDQAVSVPSPGLERGCIAHHALAPLMTVPRSRREHRELRSSQCDPAV